MIDSSVTIAGQKLFHLGTSLTHYTWEKYGFKLLCPKGAVSKDTEVIVTALVSGNFKVPKGTVLVSAVYAISVSKPLLKSLTIELQHCVDLRYTGQTGCLKFVRGPLKSPYQLSPVEGGIFSVGNRYGSIKRDQFSPIGIIAEISNGSTPNDSDSDENGSSSSGAESNHTPEGILSYYNYCNAFITCIGSDEESQGASDKSINDIGGDSEEEVKQKYDKDNGIMCYYKMQCIIMFPALQLLMMIYCTLEGCIMKRKKLATGSGRQYIQLFKI